MTRQEFEYKLYNKEFEEEELKELVDGNIEIDGTYDYIEYVDEIESSNLGRWSRSARIIFSYKNEYFEIDYEQALTELQENYGYSQPEKVKKVERQITVEDWESAECDINC